MHKGEIATLMAERDALLARLQNQSRATAGPPPSLPEAPSPTKEVTEQLTQVQLQLHEQQQKAADTIHTLQRQLLEQQHGHADATAALRAQLEDALRRAQAAEQMHAMVQQQGEEVLRELHTEQQRRRQLEAEHVELEKQQLLLGGGGYIPRGVKHGGDGVDGVDKGEGVDSEGGERAGAQSRHQQDSEQDVLIRALRGEMARLEQEVVEARRLKQYMRYGMVEGY